MRFALSGAKPLLAHQKLQKPMDGWTAWLKVAHIIALSLWTAGLFYLPPLFAAHRGKETLKDFHRLRAITRIVYLGIASPAAIVAVLTGSALIYVANAHGGWLVLKLALVSLMVVFHIYCGSLLVSMRERHASPRPAAMIALLLIPTILVPAVFYLVLVQPL
jgi:protoporphyrinogen IX oxidase